MTTFSQRKGLKPMQKLLQVDEMDQELRNGIWNAINDSMLKFWAPRPSQYSNRSRPESALHVEALIRKFWKDSLKKPADSLPYYDPLINDSIRSSYGLLRRIVLLGPWNEALDLLEFFVKNCTISGWSKALIEACNRIFEAENFAYRFVSNEIVEITDPIELSEITTALSSASRAASEHLQRALEMLSDRKSPDYRNCIKEAISAVEAVSQVVAGKPGATLNDCMKRIKSAGHYLHPLFERAIVDLYNYTSDSGGIRHALNERTIEPTYADAKYLLVLCSGFVNFLWAVAAETKITVED